MKAVKRSIILCALSLVLCVALLVGSTFAWFSDSITNSGNTITAGNLTAQWSYRALNSEDSVAYEPVSEELALFSSDTVWQPGEPQGYDFKVENTGSVDFVWELTIKLTDTAEGESNNNLTDVLVVYVDGEKSDVAFADGAKLISGTLAVSDDESTTETDGSSCEFSLAFAIPENAGNDYQNSSVSFSLVLTSKQVNGGWEASQTVEVGA